MKWWAAHLQQRPSHRKQRCWSHWFYLLSFCFPPVTVFLQIPRAGWHVPSHRGSEGWNGTMSWFQKFYTGSNLLRQWRGQGRGWKDGSAVRSDHCSYRGPRFNSRHPHGNLQLSINFHSRGTSTHFWSSWARQGCSTYMYIQAKHT